MNKYINIKEAVFPPHAVSDTRVLATIQSSDVYFYFFMIMKNWKDVDIHRSDSMVNEGLKM